MPRSFISPYLNPHWKIMSSIVINLEKIRDARRIDLEEEIIQHVAIRRMREILEDRTPKDIPNAPNGDGEDLVERPHDVVAVLGSRGSGKTTFLLSVLQDVDPVANDGKPVLLPGVDCLVNLGLIDPTLIARKENVFLIIVSRIRDAVLKAKGLNRDSANHRQWEDHLRRLARGLSALDEVGGDLLKGDWDDDQYAMEEGLATVRSHRRLEPYFHAFIDASLWLLQKRAFILGLDDIDTSFEKGWPVLETIRRYLTTKRLIVLLSGDSELFSAVVRKQQWQNLGEGLMKHDARPDYYSSLVDRLEDQYLQKILKPENRIFLDSIYSYYKSEPEQDAGKEASAKHPILTVRLTKDDEPVRLRSMIRTLLVNALFITREDDLRLYERALLEQPTRSVVQLLYHFRDAFLILCKAQNDKAEPRPLNQEERQAVERFQNSLITIFASSLQQMGWAPNLLRDMAPEDVGPMIVEHLTNRGMLDPGYRLKPEFGNTTKNLAVLTVGAQIAGMMYRQPESCLDYMLKVGLAHEVLVSASADVATRVSAIKEYVRFVGLDTMESALGVARRATAYLRGRDGRVDRQTVRSGTIALYGDSGALYPLFVMYGVNDIDSVNKLMLSKDSKHPMWDFWKLTEDDGNKGKGYFYNTLNSIEKTISNDMKGLAYLPMQLIVRGDAEQTPVASIFNLLGVLRDVMSATSRDDVWQVLLRHAQLRSFAAPNRATAAADVTAGGADADDEESDRNLNQMYHISGSLWSWVQGNRDVMRDPLSVNLIAKIWSRFYYTLLRTDAEVGKRQNNENRYYCGQLLHRFIIAFLNAVLVEEMLVHGPMTLKNPSIKDDNFILNLDSVANNKINASLFWMFWSCPLWGYFLDLRSNVSQLHRAVAYGESGRPMTNDGFYSLYPLLNSLLIQRPLKLTSPVQNQKENDDSSDDSPSDADQSPRRGRPRQPKGPV
jgi:hypothetical protein